MSIDEQHVALPKLYGAPAYARPTRVVANDPRPFDPDDLPIEAFQTEVERELASMPAHMWAVGGSADGSDGTNGGSTAGRGLRPRPLRLRSIAGRLLGGDGPT